MIFKTPIDGIGIFQLGIIQDFFKKMKIPPSKVKVIGKYFDLDMRYKTEFKRDFPIFHNSIAVQGLCPAVGITIYFDGIPEPVPHSAVIDSVAGSDDYGGPYYRCKNTDKNDRKINVGFSNQSNIHPIHEAILIQFETNQ